MYIEKEDTPRVKNDLREERVIHFARNLVRDVQNLTINLPLELLSRISNSNKSLEKRVLKGTAYIALRNLFYCKLNCLVSRGHVSLALIVIPVAVDRVLLVLRGKPFQIIAYMRLAITASTIRH